jgi:hypothetical protein
VSPDAAGAAEEMPESGGEGTIAGVDGLLLAPFDKLETDARGRFGGPS